MAQGKVAGSSRPTGDSERRDRAWTRRTWLKVGAGASIAAAAAGVTIGALLTRPIPPAETVDERLRYLAFPTDAWWDSLEGRPVNASDFAVWAGALAVWRGVFDAQNRWAPVTGLPVLVIRVPRDLHVFSAPSDAVLPPGLRLFYDDPAREFRIVSFFDRSTHLCCRPGWHVVSEPPPIRSYIASAPTYEFYDQDPIYDVCHGDQWDPMVLEWGQNPRNNVKYVGARLVYGSGFGPLPSIPLQAEGDALHADMIDPRWHEYC